jgi:hypothetical protein
VIEEFAFEEPKTRDLVALLEKLGMGNRKVLILTAEARPALYRSGRNVPIVEVMRYADAAAYDVLWSDVVVVEQGAIGGHVVAAKRTASPGRATRAKRAAAGTTKGTTKKKTAAKRPKTKTAKSATRKKGGKNA